MQFGAHKVDAYTIGVHRAAVIKRRALPKKEVVGSKQPPLKAIKACVVQTSLYLPCYLDAWRPRMPLGRKYPP